MITYHIFDSADDIIRIISNNNEIKYPLDISIKGWEDGDYFLEICMNDGGISKEEESFFKRLPLIEKVGIEQFKSLSSFMESNPLLKSVVGNVIYHYDLHIWYGKVLLLPMPF
ncbi:hypothetical protein HCG49_02280 [Arenibacter sp. 6A1]|uniref:hypothetical protein n=1 Tax=Arenibacter sp. 6A1 TaxID=2720391 RepID=UPI0014460768|nr:hypothetical protein [Arenibacter sp. 6A1]NKI25384.1 hypothetical protein [Arenibacter sp. 6A1]